MRSRSLFLVLFCCALLSGCDAKRLRKANVDEVQPGMAKKQVESILGMPTSVETKDFAGTKRTIYVYIQGKDTVAVVFKEDKMESKETTLTD